MRYLIAILFLSFINTACNEEPRRKTILSLSADLNECISTQQGSCCPVYDELIAEVRKNDYLLKNIDLNNTDVCN